jgi:hypothetical protein
MQKELSEWVDIGAVRLEAAIFHQVKGFRKLK